MWRDGSIPRSDGCILQRDGCILRQDGHLQFLPVNSISMSFSVRRIDGVDSAGHVTTVTYCLSPDLVTIAQEGRNEGGPQHLQNS